MILTTNGGTNDNAIAVALHAAYFMEGIRDCDYDLVLETWNDGCIELVSKLVDYAPFLVSLIEIAVNACANNLDFPGVLAYEVSSPFGNWIGEQIIETGEFPSDASCKKWLAAELIRFFGQNGDNAQTKAIAEAINRVVPLSCAVDDFLIKDYCSQICGGGECGHGPVCMYGIDHSTRLPAPSLFRAD